MSIFLPTTFIGRYWQLIAPFWGVQFLVLGFGVRIVGVEHWIVFLLIAVLVHVCAFIVAQKEHGKKENK